MLLALVGKEIWGKPTWFYSRVYKPREGQVFIWQEMLLICWRITFFQIYFWAFSFASLLEALDFWKFWSHGQKRSNPLFWGENLFSLLIKIKIKQCNKKTMWSYKPKKSNKNQADYITRMYLAMFFHWKNKNFEGNWNIGNHFILNQFFCST